MVIILILSFRTQLQKIKAGFDMNNKSWLNRMWRAIKREWFLIIIVVVISAIITLFEFFS